MTSTRQLWQAGEVAQLRLRWKRVVRRFRLRRERKARRFRLRGERKRVLRRFRLRRKREGRQRGSIPTHAVEAEAPKWASVVAPTAVKRVDIGVDAQSSTALPSEWASKPAQSTVIDIGGDIDAAILTTLHSEFWWWVLFLVANPWSFPAPRRSWIGHSIEPWRRRRH
ncbi:hypothetical protein LOK49_LG07G03415 [Camellia lanceoleosa]|uniref:Uncharacterized protein n=1 Tax=Camellia lanceoleosa TaxID=1840588 RepID=A0ACC0H635_9ERIC|nr:hypothetical protein LOK49_LG07G03415 [Camellia lanceoleosa]